MKLNRPLKDTRDKELSNLRFDVLFYTSGVVLVPMISEKMYNALIVEGYPGWLIISTLIICDLFFLIKVIVTFVKISQTKKLCNTFQKNIDAYYPSGQNSESPAAIISKSLKIFVLSITRKWRAERRKADRDSKVSEMLYMQVPDLLQKNGALAEENSRYKEQLLESSNANLALSQENSALQQELDKNKVALEAVRTHHPKRNVESLFLIEDEEKKELIIEKFCSILKKDQYLSEGYANNIAIYYWAAVRLRYISDNVDAFSSMFYEQSGKNRDAFRKALSRAKKKQADSISIETAIAELEKLK
ncbi:MAG: hypothetical protein ACI3Z0_11170 [Candidatus Cryptobacteroides sp.]